MAPRIAPAAGPAAPAARREKGTTRLGARRPSGGGGVAAIAVAGPAEGRDTGSFGVAGGGTAAALASADRALRAISRAASPAPSTTGGQGSETRHSTSSVANARPSTES